MRHVCCENTAFFKIFDLIWTRDERIVKFCDPDPVLIFENSVHVQTQSKFLFKCKVEVQMKCLCTTKMWDFFPLTQSKSGPVPEFLRDLYSGSNPNSTKFAIVRIQSNPSLVQCRGGTGSGLPDSTPAGFCVFLSDRIRSQKFGKNRTRSHFLISAVAEVYVVIS